MMPTATYVVTCISAQKALRNVFFLFLHYLFIQNRLFEVALEEKLKISHFWQFGKVIKTKCQKFLSKKGNAKIR